MSVTSLHSGQPIGSEAEPDNELIRIAEEFLARARTGAAQGVLIIETTNTRDVRCTSVGWVGSDVMIGAIERQKTIMLLEDHIEIPE